MNQPEDRVTDLEVLLAHQSKMLDDLSDEVARQNKEIAKLTRRVALLIENAAEIEAGGGSVVLSDQKPPHW